MTMGAAVKLRAILQMLKFFVPFFLLRAIPAWICQKVFKMGLQDRSSVNEAFFSAILEKSAAKSTKVRRIIGENPKNFVA